MLILSAALSSIQGYARAALHPLPQSMYPAAMLQYLSAACFAVCRRMETLKNKHEGEPHPARGSCGVCTLYVELAWSCPRFWGQQPPLGFHSPRSTDVVSLHDRFMFHGEPNRRSPRLGSFAETPFLVWGSMRADAGAHRTVYPRQRLQLAAVRVQRWAT